jgi:chemosensory pili system protein ChpA (sensor histidine kinase/response regulator)
MTRSSDLPDACQVLVVGVDRSSCEALVQMLESWGFSALTVYDASRAALLDKVLQPSLVLLDLDMPGMHPYEVAAAIRSEPRRRVTLIALASRESEEEEVLCKCVGIEELIHKPIGRARLHLVALDAVAAAA